MARRRRKTIKTPILDMLVGMAAVGIAKSVVASAKDKDKAKKR